MKHISSVVEEIARLLKDKQWQLVSAESCTGGLISGYITETPGSSLWFERGFVTYSNLAKIEMLAVPAELITGFGAVSEEVAAAMAQGALKHSAGQIALSVTGIAGPDGGSIDKPVGTVCFGWAVQNGLVHTVRKQYSGTRHQIRQAACYDALQGVLSTV